MATPNPVVRMGLYANNSNGDTRYAILPLNEDELASCEQCERIAHYAVMIERAIEHPHNGDLLWMKQVTNDYVCSEGCFNMWLMREGVI
jgi:hypothetical protein